MSNGKVQPQDDNIRTSRIKMGIQRTLNTAKFESIVIHYEIDEEITWADTETRERKVHNWETVLLSEYKHCHDRILEELDLSHKKAYFKDGLENKKTESNAQSLDDLEAI